MSASERRKGKNGELEVVQILKAHGWTEAERSSRGVGQAGTGDIRGGPKGCHLEVRRRETVAIWAWLLQAEREARPSETPVVVFRRSRSGWYACLGLDELLGLLAEREDRR